MIKSTKALVAGILGCWVSAQAASAPVTPTFYARQDYDGLYTSWVSIGDVNSDGIPDMVATEAPIRVLLGNGDGTFRTGPTQLTIATAIDATTLADVNGDGKLDLVIDGAVASPSYGGLIVCLGNGDGTFANGVFYPAGTDSAYQIGGFVLRDFNGDGVLDAAQVGPSGIWFFAGKGDGTFNPGVLAVPLISGGYGVAAADFNGDGTQDLVVTMPDTGPDENKGDGFYVIPGNGNGTFQTPQHFTTPIRPTVVAAGPLGANGFPGIVMGIDAEPELAAFLGNGKGGFSKPQYVPINLTGQSLGIADVNGDGIPDIVGAGSELYVALGTAANKFAKPVGYPIQSADGIYNLAIGDLRNNGQTDVVTDSNFGISVLLNTGHGSFEDGLFTKTSEPAGCGVAGDFNRDGKPDIAVNTSTGISVLLGSGKASAPLTVGQSLPLAGAGCLTQTGDLNGDGILDLAITSPAGVVTFLGSGTGTFTETSTTATSAPSGYMVLADFNRDGKLDFATAANEMALGNGDGTFQTPVPIVSNPPGGGFSNIAVGDINNDGWPDLVLTNNDIPYSDLYVLLNNQNGGFTQIPATFGNSTTEATLADLNGDGNLDLVLNTSVYLGNGKGSFTFEATLSDPIGIDFPLPSIVSDVNGDGIPDILAIGGGTVTLYVGLGNATYAPPIFFGTGPSPGSLFPANLHGQKASAGLPDLVAPDNSGGIEVLINQTK